MRLRATAGHQWRPGQTGLTESQQDQNHPIQAPTGAQKSYFWPIWSKSPIFGQNRSKPPPTGLGQVKLVDFGQKPPPTGLGKVDFWSNWVKTWPWTGRKPGFLVKTWSKPPPTGRFLVKLGQICLPQEGGGGAVSKQYLISLNAISIYFFALPPPPVTRNVHRKHFWLK